MAVGTYQSCCLLPGPSRWRKRPGRIMSWSRTSVYAVSALCLCRVIAGYVLASPDTGEPLRRVTPPTRRNLRPPSHDRLHLAPALAQLTTRSERRGGLISTRPRSRCCSAWRRTLVDGWQHQPEMQRPAWLSPRRRHCSGSDGASQTSSSRRAPARRARPAGRPRAGRRCRPQRRGHGSRRRAVVFGGFQPHRSWR